jgi:phytanoyl-CoA hydroxylase
MTFEQYKSAYDRDGFVIVHQLLRPADFAELGANLDRYIREVVPTLPDSHAFHVDKSRPETLKQLQNMDVDAYFRGYTRQPRWLGLARTLIGEEVEAHGLSEWFNKPPGTQHPTPPHQDNYYFNLKPPNVLTIWMALDPVDGENGCLRYVAGSHRRGIRRHGRSDILGFSQGIVDYGPDDESREVCIHLQPGDVVVHHGETIHRADPNRSPTRHRRAFAMVFKGASCRRDEEAFARYLAAAKAQHEKMGLKT